MTIEVEQYEKRPPRLLVVELTNENYDEVAEWLAVDRVITERSRDGDSRYIQVTFDFGDRFERMSFVLTPSRKGSYYVTKDTDGNIGRISQYDLEHHYLNVPLKQYGEDDNDVFTKEDIPNNG